MTTQTSRLSPSQKKICSSSGLLNKNRWLLKLPKMDSLRDQPSLAAFDAQISLPSPNDRKSAERQLQPTQHNVNVRETLSANIQENYLI